MRANTTTTKTGAIARTLALAGGVALASAIALAPRAEARDSRWQHHDSGRHRGRETYRFTSVPRHMSGPNRTEFRYAYAGRTYYAPHHHYHTIYRYPVVVGGVVRYRPYAYCNDTLFISGYAPLPRVVVGADIPAGIHIHASTY